MGKPRSTYTPDQVAEAFTTIRDNLDLVEVAYQEAIEVVVPPEAEFIVWDATAPGYLVEHGLPRLITPSESNFFPTSSRAGPPDLEWIAANACPKFAGNDPVVIDIECWGKKENPEDEAPTNPDEAEWLRSIVETFQRTNKGQRVGVYSYPPERYGGCSAYPPDHPEFENRWNNWTERNAIMQPLANQVHAIYPSLYGLYSDMPQWQQFAVSNIQQAYLLVENGPDPEKQVIGYLWPEWHNNAEATGPIGYDDWMVMLETCFEHCDGIALWHWSSSRYDPDAPWWRATVDFMTAHKLNGYGTAKRC